MLVSLVISAVSFSPIFLHSQNYLPKSNEARSLAISSRTNALFIGCNDGTVREVDLNTLKLRKCYRIDGTYRPVDDILHNGGNTIFSLTMSPNERYLAAMRSSKRGGYCIEVFDLISGGQFLIDRVNFTVPHFSDEALYYEGQSDWTVRSWSLRDHTDSVVIKKNVPSISTWITAFGVVCCQFKELLQVKLGDTEGSTIQLPNDFSDGLSVATSASFIYSGSYVIVDRDAKIFFSSSLGEPLTQWGVADDSPLLPPGKCRYVPHVKFINNDEFLTLGTIRVLNGSLQAGKCTVWNAKSKAKRIIDLQQRGSIAGMDVTANLLAVSYGSTTPGHVELYDLKTGKLMATLSSAYCDNPNAVTVKSRKY